VLSPNHKGRFLKTLLAFIRGSCNNGSRSWILDGEPVSWCWVHRFEGLRRSAAPANTPSASSGMIHVPSWVIHEQFRCLQFTHVKNFELLLPICSLQKDLMEQITYPLLKNNMFFVSIKMLQYWPWIQTLLITKVNISKGKLNWMLSG
jgi:hypothetical protein